MHITYFLLSLCMHNMYVCMYVSVFVCLLLNVPPLLQLIYPKITNKSEIRANAAGSSANDIHIDIDGPTCDEWPRSRAYQLQFLSRTRAGRTSGAPLPAHTQTHTRTRRHSHSRCGQRRSKTHRAGSVCCLLSAVQLQLQQR